MSAVHVREAELDELMARLATGDRTAFEPLYVALHGRAERLVLRRLARAQAEDVVQSAMTSVFARASEFTPGRPCLPWFYAVVANELRAATRRDARLVLSDEMLERASEDDPERLFVERELERALELAIDALDEDSGNAIRALLGRAPVPIVPGATFRKRVSRAYVKLRVLLGGHDAS